LTDAWITSVGSRFFGRANHVYGLTLDKLGAHSVTGFYMISGYLMTMVINETYVGWTGLLRYATNRFLRIYPLYWLAAILTIFGIILVPHAFENINPALKLPSDANLWFRNLTLVSMIYSPVRLVPPTWSLSVECFFYIGLGLVLARGRVVAIAWFAVSAAYTIYLVIGGVEFADRYYPVQAASLFFSIGALIYHLRPHLPSLKLSATLWCVLLAVFSAFPVLVASLGGNRYLLGYYGAALLFIVLFISALQRSLPLSQKMDRFLGDLAYPVFLLHYFSVGIVRIIASRFAAPRSFIEAALVVALTIALALLVNRYFDPAINQIRNVVRRTPKSADPAYLPAE
jgi:peptidoglycan/LPS O-acetylase OafA/YrhL